MIYKRESINFKFICTREHCLVKKIMSWAMDMNCIKSKAKFRSVESMFAHCKLTFHKQQILWFSAVSLATRSLRPFLQFCLCFLQKLWNVKYECKQKYENIHFHFMFDMFTMTLLTSFLPFMILSVRTSFGADGEFWKFSLHLCNWRLICV